MPGKMPRGAIPTPRSEIAASEPFRPESGSDLLVPSGEFPSPNHELAAASPFKGTSAPASFLAWPVEVRNWEGLSATDSLWAEEAFAKACADPRVSIPVEAIQRAAQECGSTNFSRFMQTRGLQMDRKVYLDGPFFTVDWANAAGLHAAIAHVGPVKIGVDLANLASGSHSRVTPGTSGWATYGLPKSGQPQSHCASLCGYGALTELADLFESHGVRVNVPPGMPTGLCYATFTQGSIGIVDRQSLMNILGEAWVRNPTTIVKS
jgi:hypothetical protein